VDLIVVGNGIIALSTAFHVAARAGAGDRIRIVGPSARAGSATLAAAAMLNSFAELEAGALDREVDRFRFELSRRASRAWRAFASELAPGESLGFGTGTYVLQSDRDDFEAIVAALRDTGEPHALVAPSEIPWYRPGGATARRAVFLPDEGWIDPRAVLDQLERALVARGVGLVDATVARLHSRAGAIDAVELADGHRLEADRYLVANGASAGDLVRSLQLSMQRVLYGIGVSVELRGADCTQALRAGSVYAVPMSGGRTFAGATSFVSPTPSAQPPEGSVDELVRAVAAQIDRELGSAEILRVNTGWRPTSEDSYPLVGPTSIANLVIATGTRRDGFHLAPVLAEYLSALLRGEDVDPRMAVFAPERALLRG
jgi:glycine/D-amino acid oxidase-like deaminating enzyme